MPADDVDQDPQRRHRRAGRHGQDDGGRCAALRRGRRDAASAASTTARRPSTPSPRRCGARRSITGAIHHAGVEEARASTSSTRPATRRSCTTRGNCLAAATGVVVVLGSTGGEMKVEIEKVWAWCEELGLPRIGFVTRLDRERASLDHALADLATLGAKPAVLQVPIGSEGEFQGVVDVLSGQGVRLPGRLGHVSGGRRARRARRRRSRRRASSWSRPSPRRTTRSSRSTSRAPSSTPEELRAGLHEATRAGQAPADPLRLAARAAIGLHPLLDAIVDLLPSPAELPAWKGDNPKTGERGRARRRSERAVLGLRASRPSSTRSPASSPSCASSRATRAADLSCVNASREAQGAHRPSAEARGQEADARSPPAVAGRHRRASRSSRTRRPATRSPTRSTRSSSRSSPDAPAAISFALAAEEQGRRREGHAGRSTA